MDSDFKKWMDSLGFNGKEVTKAGAVIGIGMTSSRERYRDEKELSLTERLAMSAIAAGLPAWSTETKAEVDTLRRVIEPVREILAEQKPLARYSSGQRVPAE